MEANKEIVLNYLKREYRNFGTTLSSIQLLLELFTTKYNYIYPVSVAWKKLSDKEQAFTLLEFIEWSEDVEPKSKG